MSAPKRHARDDERGFVLLLVLAGLAFLSFVAAATLADQRHAARVAAARAGEIEAGLLAEAGIARAMLAIDEDFSTNAWPENGTPEEFSFGGGKIAMSIADEAGKINLATAPELMVEAVLKRAGLSPSRATAIAATLRTARTNAAVASRSFAPVSLEALGQIVGLGAAEIAQLRPYVTVHTGLTGFDPAVAPAALVEALPGADATALASFRPSVRADDPSRADSPAPAFTILSPRRIFTIRAEACTADGHLAAREAVVERQAPGRFARIELREPLDTRYLATPCIAQKLAAATNH